MCSELEQVIRWFSENEESKIRKKIPRVNREKMILSLKNLQNMIGMEDAKRSFADQIKFIVQNGGRADGHFLHTIIRGDPGTGKTTLGIVLAHIWSALGVLNGGAKKDHQEGSELMGSLAKDFVQQLIIKRGQSNGIIGSEQFGHDNDMSSNNPFTFGSTTLLTPPSLFTHNAPLNTNEIDAISRVHALVLPTANLVTRVTLLKKLMRGERSNSNITQRRSSVSHEKEDKEEENHVFATSNNLVSKNIEALDLEVTHFRDELKFITSVLKNRVKRDASQNNKAVNPATQHFRQQWSAHGQAPQEPFTQFSFPTWVQEPIKVGDAIKPEEDNVVDDDRDDEWEDITDDGVPNVEPPVHSTQVKYRVVSRADCVGQYMGSTAVKTTALLEECRGGCVVFDEFYSFYNSEKDSFGAEAVNTFCQWMSENPGEIIVIALGYKDMLEKTVFQCNPGLARRFGWTFDIEPYNAEQLASIFERQVQGMYRDFNGGKMSEDTEKTSWALAASAKECLPEFFKKAKEFFSNMGGDTNNFLFQCKLAYARNNWSKLDWDAIDHNPTKEITPDILEQALEMFKKSAAKEKKTDQDMSALYMYL